MMFHYVIAYACCHHSNIQFAHVCTLSHTPYSLNIGPHPLCPPLVLSAFTELGRIFWSYHLALVNSSSVFKYKHFWGELFVSQYKLFCTFYWSFVTTFLILFLPQTHTHLLRVESHFSPSFFGVKKFHSF